MKTLVISLALLFFIPTIHDCVAQTALVSKSSGENKLATAEYVTQVLGADDEGFYVLSTNQGTGSSMMKKFTIQKFDNTSLNKLWSKEISLNVSSEPVEGIFYVNHEIVLFYSTWEKSDKTKTLNIKTISSKGEIKDSQNKEVRIKTGIFDFANRNFYFSFSSNNSKILVTNKFIDKKKNEEATVAILNSNDFKKVSEKMILNKYNNSPILTYNYQVDNDGTIYYLASYQTGEIVNNNFCALKPSATEPQILPIALSNQAIVNSALYFKIKEYNLSSAGIAYIENANELSYQILPNNKICLGGIFKDFKQKKCGFFTSNITANDLKTTSQKEHYFSDQVNEQIKSSNKGKSPIECDYGFNSIELNGNSLLFFFNAFKVVGYSPEMAILSDNVGTIAFNIVNNDIANTHFFVNTTRNVGASKISIQKYQKNNSTYLCLGVPDSKNIESSSLNPFKAKFEEAKQKGNDISFIEMNEKGINSIYFGTSTTVKKESILMVENFLTINGSFLLPLIDYNNVTSSSTYVRYELIDLK
jgi:hypothetical protein